MGRIGDHSDRPRSLGFRPEPRDSNRFAGPSILGKDTWGGAWRCSKARSTYSSSKRCRGDRCTDSRSPRGSRRGPADGSTSPTPRCCRRSIASRRAGSSPAEWGITKNERRARYYRADPRRPRAASRRVGGAHRPVRRADVSAHRALGAEADAACARGERPRRRAAPLSPSAPHRRAGRCRRRRRAERLSRRARRRSRGARHVAGDARRRSAPPARRAARRRRGITSHILRWPGSAACEFAK